MAKKKRTCARVAKTLVQEFGDVTTLHGIRYITEPKVHLIERLLWSIGLITSAVLCGLEVSKLYSRWQESPVITSFAEKPMPVSSIPFPAITICPENKVLREYLDVEENMKWIEKVFSDSNSTFNASERLLAECVSMICDAKGELSADFTPTSEHVAKIKEVKENYFQISIKISPKLNDVFDMCRFLEETYNCETLFRPIVTLEGICFTFNTLDFKDIINHKYAGEENETEYLRLKPTWSIDGGYVDSKENEEYPRRERLHVGPPETGLVIELKSNKGDSQKTCSFINSDNYKISIHSPIEIPVPEYKYFHVSPSTQVLVSIQPEMIVTENSLRPPKYNPETRGCFFPEERPTFAIRNLTKQNCFLDVHAESMQKGCNCSFFSNPLKDEHNQSLEFCKIGSSDCKEIAKDWECLPSCHELQYNFHLSSSNYEPPIASDNNRTIKYTRLIIFFEKSTFFPLKKSELYGVTDFIANCGGLLGLFTGFSVVSFMEIVYFGSIRFFCRLRQASRGSQEKIM